MSRSSQTPSMRYYEPILLDPFKAKREFNPRYLDFNEVFSTATQPDRNFAYREVDEASFQIKILNFSRRICHIGYRDGSVTTLRNTEPNLIEGRRCYLSNVKQNVDGSWDYPNMKHDDFRKQVPHVREGIYILIKKSISTSTSIANKGISTILYDDPETNRSIVGRGYGDLLGAHGGLGEHEKYTYNYADEYREQDLEGYCGPVYFSGELGGYKSKSPGKGERRPGNRHHEAMMIEYFVPIEQLTDVYNQYLYLEELDLVVSASLSKHQLIHPFSIKGKMEKQLHDIHHRENSSSPISGISIINVDNSGDNIQANTFYTNLGGQVVKIPAIRNEAQRDGLYVYTHNQMEGEKIKPKETVYLTHSDALSHTRVDVPAFYRTYAEAESLGNLVEKQKEEQRKIEFEQNARLTQLKAELELKKAEFEQFKREMENRSMERKDHYEERSYRRKDESEWLKWVMGVGGVVIGLALNLSKK